MCNDREPDWDLIRKMMVWNNPFLDEDRKRQDRDRERIRTLFGVR
jgi:hypothetical protein